MKDPAAVPGRASRAAVTAALHAHVAVLKGEGLRGALQQSLRDAEKLGGQERRYAAFVARELSRHQRLLDWASKRLGQAPGSWLLAEDKALIRYTLWRRLQTGADWPRIRNEVSLPGPIRPRSVRDDVLEALSTQERPVLEVEALALEPAVRFSLPRWLAEQIEASVPAGEGAAVMEALNRDPGLVLRCRPLGSAAEVQALLAAEGIPTEAVGLGTDGVRVLEESHRIFETPCFKGGRLQVQDVGSQLIVQLCRPLSGFSGAHVVDVCAGAGGKTLFLADAVGPGGRVDAGDSSSRRLSEARDRVAKWKLKQVHFPSGLGLERADVVLLDAPCSGTGSLGRDPDQKWKLGPGPVKVWMDTQAKLLNDAARRMRSNSVLVYATCSLLRDENEAQVERFLRGHPAWKLEPAGEVLTHAPSAVEGPYLQALPHRVGGAGFFAARLRRNAPD